MKEKSRNILYLIDKYSVNTLYFYVYLATLSNIAVSAGREGNQPAGLTLAAGPLNTAKYSQLLAVVENYPEKSYDFQ
ncbi:hypothetical protein [Kamptonema formosum]|uniref:hypothetical protein n=1 Tax=Kamptonema formosum TaxID=331992 RepID=UPI0012DF1A27|nr:hypothetical protein [Oscillatoria sp. PCC 10802]